MKHRNLCRRNAPVREGSRPVWCEYLLHRRDRYFVSGCGNPIFDLAILGRRNDVNVARPSIAHARIYDHLDEAGKVASCQKKTH
jgi:hypothetical protein